MIVVILETGVFFIIGYFVLRTYLKRLIYLSHFVCILFAFSISCTVLLEVSFHIFQKNENSSKQNLEIPIILWWTPQIGRRNEIRKCYNRECVISYDRNLRNRSNTKAFAFYGSNIDPEDLPLPKIDMIWALLHEESPKNTPILLNDDFLKLFDFTSTFSRLSHFPLNALHLENINDIRDLKYFVPLSDKNAYIKEGIIASVLYIQSDCDTFTDRDAYVAELSKYISIDSYGRCLNNAKLPENVRNVSDFYSNDFLHFVSRYKFTLAIENAVCDDYITEKLWRTLIVGSVPIYFGSPSVRDWLPNHESAILISDFNGPRDLSIYLNKINSNDKLCELMIAHKLDGTISNQMLKNIMKSRRWKWAADDNHGNFIDEFECQMCLYLHGDKLMKNNTKTNGSHYSCSTPYSILTGEKNKSNHWNDIIRYEKCQGKVISSFISKNIDFVDTDVKEDIDKLIREKEC